MNKESEIAKLVEELESDSRFSRAVLGINNGLERPTDNRKRIVFFSEKVRVIYRRTDDEHSLTVYDEEKDFVPFSDLPEVACGRDAGETVLKKPEKTEFTVQDVRDYISRCYEEDDDLSYLEEENRD